MREIELLVLYRVFFFFLISSSIFSQSYPDYMVNFWLKSGTENLINQNYDGASNDFLSLKNEFPNLSIGEISLNTLTIIKMKDFAEEIDADSFLVVLDSTISHSQKLLEQNPNSLWNIYFCGLAEANYALFQSEQENYFSTYSHTKSAVGYMEKCIELDSLFYDAYSVIGAYNYWMSAKTEFINWLPFISDDKEIGIKYSEIAAEKGNYNKFFAASNLVWIYKHSDQIDKAKVLVTELCENYPFNRSAKWMKANIFSIEEPKKSIELYTELLDYYKGLEHCNKINVIILAHKIAMLYKNIGEFHLALDKCNYILGLSNLDEYTLIKVNDRITRVRNLKEEIDGILSKKSND